MRKIHSVSVSPLLHPTKRSEWRSWLRNHYKVSSGIWLVYHKKHTGKPRISYNDAVEEALCFGWIDSIVKSVDRDMYAQRFSPRKDFRHYSQANIERLRRLVAERKVVKDVIDVLPDLSQKRLQIAADVMAAIRANRLAHSYFRRLPKAYVRIRIAFIEGARKRPAEFQKRLANFVKMTAQNKLIGFGGITKYYHSQQVDSLASRSS